MSETEVIFKDKNENSKTLDIRSDSDWNVSVDGSPSWCKATKPADGASKKLLIEMAEANNTKSARTAKVVITSGTGRYVIYVTQSMTSKY